jgi:hypothetical protein
VFIVVVLVNAVAEVVVDDDDGGGGDDDIGVRRFLLQSDPLNPSLHPITQDPFL